MSYYGGTVTVKGRDLISHLLAGETIELTRIVVGSGEMPEGVEPIDMEELVTPVALASSTVPTVKDGVLSMTVEYRNDMNGGLETGFWLREFGIFARTDESEEILLYYATLGDSPQPVNAYTDNRIDTRRYPISIALALDAEVTVEYNPGAFITAEDAEERIKALVDEAIADIPAAGAEEITLPTEGWQEVDRGEEGEETGSCGLYYDAEIEGVTEDMIPTAAIHPDSLNTARDCELCHTAKTIDGAVRFYTREVPSSAISITVELTSTTAGAPGGGGGSYTLPTATANRLGGIKIGVGLAVQNDGTASVDTEGIADDITDDVTQKVVDESSATDEEVDEALDDVFGSGSGEAEVQDGDDPADDDF